MNGLNPDVIARRQFREEVKYRDAWERLNGDKYHPYMLRNEKYMGMHYYKKTSYGRLPY